LVKIKSNKPYCADYVGVVWKREGDVQEVNPRFLKDWDIKAGLNKGILEEVK